MKLSIYLLVLMAVIIEWHTAKAINLRDLEKGRKNKKNGTSIQHYRDLLWIKCDTYATKLLTYFPHSILFYLEAVLNEILFFKHWGLGERGLFAPHRRNILECGEGRNQDNQTTIPGRLESDPEKFHQGGQEEEERAEKATRHFKNTYMRSLMGPRGPRGPVGPLDLRDTTDNKEETKINHTKLDHLTLIAEDTVPKISTAFMWETKEFLYVPKQTKVEIDMFQKERNKIPPTDQQAYYPGSYNHGVNRSNPMTGRFEAPRTGFYHLNAIFHVAFQNLPAYSYELFSLSIKICGSDNKTSLQAISGIGPSKRTTVAVSGVLHLKINEYVSVFIENSSQGNITIIVGTQFSGYLVGV
ncbi:adipolin [Caerostris extrusa]|uniref:Adipolin n=1 Tax=Caerostris extrusa TaxID=172846 RepID=A0AAV4WBP5_CAEEX|nr:adipolin [Caerostris extrusa]